MGVADLEGVAEDPVEPNLESGDPGAFPLLRLDGHHRRLRVASQVAQEIELGIRPLPNHPSGGGENRGIGTEASLDPEHAIARVGNALAECAETAGGEAGGRLENGRDRLQARGEGGDFARSGAAHGHARESPLEVAHAFEQGLQSLRDVAAAHELLDRVPSRLELDRIPGRMGEGFPKGARSERRSRPIEEREEASRGRAVRGLEQLERGDGRGIEPHPFTERERNRRADVLEASGPHLPRVRQRRPRRAPAPEGNGGVGVSLERLAEPGGVTPGDGRGIVRRLCRVVEQDLARAEQGERVPHSLRRNHPRVEAPRREVQEGDSPVRVPLHERRQVARGVGSQGFRIEDRAGRHDAGDVAADEALGGARVLDLVADGDLAARRHELGDVMIDALVRDAAHRRLDVGVLVPGRQRDAEQRRRLLRVVEEHLVEVAHPIEEDGVRDPALHLEVLPEHRGHTRDRCAHAVVA